MNVNVVLSLGGNSFNCSARQAAAINTLLETQKGGFARVNGYTTSPKKKGEVGEVYNMSFLSRFSLENLYKRKIAALEKLTYADVAADFAKLPKLAALTVEKAVEMFEARKAKEIASMQKTLDGVRDDARRQSHDRNYASVGSGIKVHFVTEKDSEGLTYPVIAENGLPTVKNIMVSAIEVSRQVLKEGVYFGVDSGPDKLIGNVMESKMPKSCKIKTLSLGDNFESLQIDGNAILPKDIAGDFSAD